MSLLIAPILFILVILFVAYPLLLDAAQEEKKERALSREEKALRIKDDVMGTLKDIEMDFHMGKLSEQDYGQLKAEYEGQAAAAFETLDRLGRKGAAVPKDRS